MEFPRNALLNYAHILHDQTNNDSFGNATI